MVDYPIHHRKADGRLSRKVFKGRKRKLAAGETWTVEACHRFRQITTRAYHAGEHRIEPLINGKFHVQRGFELQIGSNPGSRAAGSQITLCPCHPPLF